MREELTICENPIGIGFWLPINLDTVPLISSGLILFGQSTADVELSSLVLGAELGFQCFWIQHGFRMPAEDLVKMLKAAEGAGGLRRARKAFVMDSLQADVVAEAQTKQHKLHSPWSRRVSALKVGTVRI